MSENRSSADAGAAEPTRETPRARQFKIGVAAIVFLASLVYYGTYLFPGLGGELNAGDSAKFQILGHTPILVHGPGYPIILMLGAVLRALQLPLEPWWSLTFAMSAIPASIANTAAFLIAQRLTRSLFFGIGTALLLGTAGLMAVQATEAEVYALALAFVLSITFCLVLFVETRNERYFLAACAIYAMSFGNHLMMIMLISLFVIITFIYRNTLLTAKNAAWVAGFVVLGASQYLYLAYVSYHPDTAYSEYMPLPPEPMELIEYILGLYFSDLYGSGVGSTRTAEALLITLQSSHSWISVPAIVAGIVLFLYNWRSGGSAWRSLAVVYGAALAFVPFALWYGAYDIQAFHLPVLGPLLVATGASIGWWFGRHFVPLGKAVAALLILIGLVRAGQVSSYFEMREPIFDGLKPAMAKVLARSPVENPLVVMTYGMRMATLYYELRDEMPGPAAYRVSWRAVSEVENRAAIGGIVIPTDGYQFVSWIEHYRPDVTCTIEDIELPEGERWPAYAFECE